MKKLHFIILAFACISCGGKITKEKKDSVLHPDSTPASVRVEKIGTMTLPSGFKSKMLPAKLVKGTVTVPAEASIYLSGLSDNEGTRDMIIIQMNDTGMQIEMYSTGLTLDDAIQRVKNSMWTPLHHVLDKNDTCIQFTRGSANSGKEDSYDFILQVNSDGTRWLIRPSDSRDYTREEIALLLAVARSVKL